MTPVRHWTSRKFVAGTGTAVILVVGALIVHNGNYSALATALVALFGTFSAGNVVAGAVGGKRE